MLGEEPQAGRIARVIVESRQKASIDTTAELAALVEKAYPAAWRAKARRHPATRTFQALRMAVNDELGDLRRFLDLPDKLLARHRSGVIVPLNQIDAQMPHRFALFNRFHAFRQQQHVHGAEAVNDRLQQPVGFFVLLDAAERSRLPVVIVGGGPLEAEVRREAQQRGLSNVVFTGMLNDEDKYILFQLCRGVVFPSHLRSEAFGITLLEGARFARPLISCEIGTGTSFINQDKVSGCVIPPNDSQALVEAMNELWNNEETSNRYGENSRRRFEEMFTADHMIDAYVNLYTTLLESKS